MLNELIILRSALTRVGSLSEKERQATPESSR